MVMENLQPRAAGRRITHTDYFCTANNGTIYQVQHYYTASLSEVLVCMPSQEQRCLETCQERQSVRCQGCRANCSTLKPSSSISVKACKGKVAVCYLKRGTFCLLTYLLRRGHSRHIPQYRYAIHSLVEPISVMWTFFLIIT